MNIQALVLIICSLVNIVLPFFILGRDFKARANRVFFTLSVGVVGWMNCSYFTDHAATTGEKLFFCRAAYALGVPIVGAIYAFSWYFPKRHLPKKHVRWLFYGLSLLVFVLSFTKGVVSSVKPGRQFTAVVSGMLLVPYVVFLLVYMGLSLVRFYHARRESTNYQTRTRISYLATGMAAGLVWAILTNVILSALAPNLGTPRLGPIASLLLIIPFAYAIGREKLLDIRQVFVQTGAFFFTSLVVIGSFWIVIFNSASRALAHANFTHFELLIFAIVTACLGFLTPAVYTFFVALLRQLFYRDAYEMRDLVDKFNKLLASNDELPNLLNSCGDLIGNTLKLEFCTFIVKRAGGVPIVSGAKDSPLAKLDSAKLDELSLKHPKLIITNELLGEPNAQLKSLLVENGVAILVRLSDDSLAAQNRGYLLIGAKHSGNSFVRQDQRFFVNVADELNGVIDKSLRVEQDFEHVTQEMYRKNLELTETNQTLSLLRTIDTLVLESQDSLEQLGDQISQAVVDNSNFSLVMLFAKLPHGESLNLVGHGAGNSDTKTGSTQNPLMRLDTDHSWFKSDEMTLSLHVKDPEAAAMHSIGLNEKTLNSFSQKTPIKTLYFMKLRARQKLVGLLIVGFPDQQSQHISEHDTSLLGRLSEAVGVAIDSKLLFDENQRVLKQLQKTNDKLRALDEAKDEFISMASHQLRTPLTSVKGYVSMVIDGDAGKLSKAQRDLLGQAFTSSQRMVYLIADLLNVSRLRTGKFVIENKPTQLADVVETELSQLQEGAKVKHLELSYTKPKNFPLLMMDETKIRQVIMNFTDNALYYTPNGGHIHVNLEDKGRSIEFTVVDDGIGVPKSEQHHMFSKFYRAGNARKARPDGTGLGIFMAKKVIIAQGGAVVFKSVEGKGSTFGFTFSKNKLKVPAKVAVKAATEGAIELTPDPKLDTPKK